MHRVRRLDDVRRILDRRPRPMSLLFRLVTHEKEDRVAFPSHDLDHLVGETLPSPSLVREGFPCGDREGCIQQQSSPVCPRHETSVARGAYMYVGAKLRMDPHE